LLETGVYAMTSFTRFYAVPRAVPPTRVAILREGLTKTLADPRLLAEASAAGLVIAPISAAALQATLDKIKTNTAALEKVRSILTEP
jgi:hypothetical protein